MAGRIPAETLDLVNAVAGCGEGRSEVWPVEAEAEVGEHESGYVAVAWLTS